jgi:phage shock protein A
MSTSTITADTTQWADDLMQMLDQQWALVEQLESLAKRQGELIRDRKTDALLGLLGERQQIIDQFLIMQNRLGDLMENLDERLEHLKEQQRTRIRSRIDQISVSLDAVMQHDERDRSALQANRDETKGEMNGLGNASRARQAYLGAAGGTPRFADRQG